MRSSFIGIVTEEGLESLLPECELTRTWSRDVVDRRRAACVWAVMDQKVAAEIVELLADGEGRCAFRHLATAAETVGRVM